MKMLLYTILFLGLGNIFSIFDRNEFIDEAQNGFIQKEYKKSLAALDSLTNYEDVPQQHIQLNQGHAHYLQKDTANLKASKSYYKLITGSDNKDIASISYNQTGNINFEILASKNPEIITQKKLTPETKKEVEKILEQYKDALRADQNNAAARYNYELLHGLIFEYNNQQQQQNKDQQNQNKEDKKDQKQDQDKNNKQDQKGEDKEQNKKNEEKQKGDKKEEKQQKKGEEEKKGKDSKQEEQKNSKQSQEKKKGEEQTKGKKEEGQKGKPMKEIQLSKEEAMQLLKAGQSKEKKYLERRKKQSSEPIDSDKPDW